MKSGNRTVEEMSTFRKRPRVLARFFQRSRNQWKRKCEEAKALVKYWQVRGRDLEKSRQQWREVAEQQRLEVERLRQEKAELQALLEGRSQVLEPKARAAGVAAR